MKFLKQILTTVICSSLFTFAQASPDRTDPGWEPMPVAFEPLVTGSLHGRNFEKYTSELLAVNAAGRTIYNDIKATLRDGFSELARTEISKKGWQLLESNLSMTGPLELRIVPGAGNHVLSLGGPRVVANIKVQGRQSGLGFVCTASIGTDRVELVSDRYDTGSGEVYGLRVVPDTLWRNGSCESSLSWIPVIGDLADAIVNAVVRDKLSAILSNGYALRKDLISRSNFLALQSSLRNQITNEVGEDVSRYLRDNLAGFFASSSVSVFIQEPYFRTPFYFDWFRWFMANPAQDYPKFRELQVSVSFQGGGTDLAIRTFEEISYSAFWECPWTWQQCEAPI